jgi:hypothetical protein
MIHFGLDHYKTIIEGQQQKTKRRLQKSYFHPYFWEQLLLNNKKTLMESFAHAVQILLGK